MPCLLCALGASLFAFAYPAPCASGKIDFVWAAQRVKSGGGSGSGALALGLLAKFHEDLPAPEQSHT